MVELKNEQFPMEELLRDQVLSNISPKRVDNLIIWNIGKGRVSLWFDKWSSQGPLNKYLMYDVKPSKILLTEVKLYHDVPDKAIWTLDNEGKFSI
ncbi:hypothetical protein H5410_046650 [Solanum commersonii]|uniref:Uncharacterized protein n=1 Tax=Solanum commersonii TaxID=4109 RepID=A0A9J5XH15_SOLCO|nr:hypothetical protein H5410_046650 [Solanum commersonii]